MLRVEKVFGHVVMLKKEKYKVVMKALISMLNGLMKKLKNISLINH